MALFDRNMGAVRDGAVDGRIGNRHIEWYLMVLCRDRQLIGADFVGGVSVCGNAVGSDDHEIDLQFEDNAAVCVVLASDGYPVSYEKGFLIEGLENFKDKDGYYCFHAGSKMTEKGIVTNGGRVLGITAKGADLKEARKNAYAATEWVNFANKYMRHDIGKAIDEA